MNNEQLVTTALIRYVHSQPYALLVGRKQFAPDVVLVWDGERLVQS